MKLVCKDYYTNGVFNPQVPRMKFVNAFIKNKRKIDFAKKTISRIPHGFTVTVMDESIFIHDSLVRRKMRTAGCDEYQL